MAKIVTNQKNLSKNKTLQGERGKREGDISSFWRGEEKYNRFYSKGRDRGGGSPMQMDQIVESPEPKPPVFVNYS